MTIRALGIKERRSWEGGAGGMWALVVVESPTGQCRQ